MRKGTFLLPKQLRKTATTRLYEGAREGQKSQGVKGDSGQGYGSTEGLVKVEDRIFSQQGEESRSPLLHWLQKSRNEKGTIHNLNSATNQRTKAEKPPQGCNFCDLWPRPTITKRRLTEMKKQEVQEVETQGA